ncbi:hypothetical protein C4546_03200 [Candidatus Parcubacteria bacterium]|jgi:hypothetical protein|nr:MAG: hypothetical protein C4546_03200 [Candidatus Parcubacteria bacterium]
MLFLKTEQEWCEKHARVIHCANGPVWLCKDTDGPIITMSFERIIAGKSYYIHHLFCEKCNPWPTLAELNAIPISSADELVGMPF